jgi:hypothetical protein
VRPEKVTTGTIRFPHFGQRVVRSMRSSRSFTRNSELEFFVPFERFGETGGFHGSYSGHAALAMSSLSTPRATIRNASSGNGRCSAFASSHGARIHTSRASSVVRITGIALGCIG